MVDANDTPDTPEQPAPRFATTGQDIVSATTGQQFKYRVGSSDELLFWKVVDARIYPESDPRSATDPLKYFFESPEAYGLIIDGDSKKSDIEGVKRWRERRAEHMKKRDYAAQPLRIPPPPLLESEDDMSVLSQSESLTSDYY